MHNKCNTLESSWNKFPHPLVHRKFVFHENGPWCQKSWRLLFYILLDHSCGHKWKYLSFLWLNNIYIFCIHRYVYITYSVSIHQSLGICDVQFSSVQFSHSVMSDPLLPHESQHARPPCPSPSPRVHPDSHPSSQWCHPAISSSVVPFSSCPQSLPASEPFPMSQLFAWGSQSTGVSALASVLPKNAQDWSALEWILVVS